MTKQSLRAAPLCLLITLALAVLRLSGLKSPAFQAVAHLYVGMLVGAWAVSEDGRVPIRLALFLTAVEVFAFFFLK